MRESTIRIEHDGTWLEADLAVAPRDWTRGVVERRWKQEAARTSRKLAPMIAENMAEWVEIFRSQDPPPLMLFLLYPKADRPVVTAVAVRSEAVDRWATLDDVHERLRMPEEMLESPAQEAMVDTLAGPALRLLQHYRVPASPGIEEVQAHLAYAWVLADDLGSVVVTVSTSFPDLVDAGQWGPAVDELARSLTLEPGPA